MPVCMHVICGADKPARIMESDEGPQAVAGWVLHHNGAQRHDGWVAVAGGQQVSALQLLVPAADTEGGSVGWCSSWIVAARHSADGADGKLRAGATAAAAAGGGLTIPAWDPPAPGPTAAGQCPR